MPRNWRGQFWQRSPSFHGSGKCPFPKPNKLDKLLMRRIIQNIGRTVIVSRFPAGACHRTGGENTPRTDGGKPVRGGSDSPPVSLGEVCADVLGSLFPNVFPSCARTGRFRSLRVATCRNRIALQTVRPQRKK